MKKAILFLFLLGIGLQLQAQVVFVKPGGNGDGSSWQAAIGDLHKALKKATVGTQVWVAAGTYQTSPEGNRLATFVIPDGIRLYGSFAGYETALTQRKFTQPTSTLSGEINTGSIEDNAYTVVYTYRTANLVVDGFVITGGNANGDQKGTPMACGGAWFNDGRDGGVSMPQIQNCIFVENHANYGAGLYNAGTNGSCSGTLVENCRFEKNEAQLDGGAIFNEGTFGQCNIMVRLTTFSDNRAVYGAGIINFSDEGSAVSTLDACVFEKNFSVDGSCVYNYRGIRSTCKAPATNCIFNCQAVLDGITNSNKLEDSQNKDQQKVPSKLKATTFR